MSRTLASLPGPRRWPLVGNLPQVDAKRMHVRLESWAAEYGPLYRVHLGRGDVLVVARSDCIAGMLRDRPDGWRRLRSMQSVIREMGGHGLFSAEADDWRRQRRLVMRAFDPRHLQRFFPSLVRVTERLMARLEDAAASGEALDLQALLMRYTVDVTAGLAFGVEVNTLDQPGDALQAHLDQVFPMMMKRIFAPVKWWRHVRLPSDRRFEVHLAKVHEAVAGFVAAARQRLADDPSRRDAPTDLLEALIAAGDDAGGSLSEEEVVGNVMTVLLAGEDTTANTLAWTLYLLYRHPDALADLVRDVDAVLGDDPLPRRFDDTKRLDAIERCVQESMRLHPVAPIMLMQNNEPTTVGDVALAADTTVLCLTRPAAVDTDVRPDADAFRPGRWNETDAAMRGLLKSSMPFGAGPRLCPGRSLAMLEMKMVLSMIARNFTLVDVATHDGTPPDERLAFTMYPVGLKLRVSKR